MRTLWQDLRYGARMLLKQKGVTAVAVLSLALGIGANTALFSVVDAMLLKSLPVKEPQRLALFQIYYTGGKFSPGSQYGPDSVDPVTGQTRITSFTLVSFQRMRERQGALSHLFAFLPLNLNVVAGGQADVANGQVASGNYYAGLGVQPLLGRLLADEDDKPNATPVAVLSYRYWQKRFGADAGIVGKQINLNNAAFTVIGVTPQGFEGTGQVGDTRDITVPLALEPQLNADPKRSMLYRPELWWLILMGRLKPGATLAQAQAQLENAFRQSVAEHRAALNAQSLATGGKALAPCAARKRLSPIRRRTPRRAQCAIARYGRQGASPARSQRLSAPRARFRRAGRDEFARVLRAVVISAARRRRDSVADCLRQRRQSFALARFLTAKRNRRAVGARRKSRTFNAAIADRKRFARGGGRRAGFSVRDVDQRWFAGGRRLGRAGPAGV